MATKKPAKKTTTKVSAKPAIKTKKLEVKKDLTKVVSETKIPEVSIKIEKEQVSIPVTKKPMDENQKRRITGVVTAIVAISLFAGFSFYTIPNQILSQTIDKQNARKAEKDKRESEVARQDLQSRLDVESGILKFDQNKSWDLVMNIKEFGDLKLNLKSEYAPKTVENFVRLSYREVFNNTIFHRIVKQPTFAVIQGGDTENRNGQGGKSAFYVSQSEPENIPDELWIVEPEFQTVGEKNTLINKPEFRFPSLYTNFKTDTGTVTYKKGLILMAKTDQPDSASSQFFVTLSDTELPAQYTIFGTVDPGSFGVLDKITTEINPISVNQQTGAEEAGFDGRPSKELRINTLKIASPQV